MAAPLQDTSIAGAWSRRQALCTRVPEAETGTHLESLTASRTVEQPQARTCCCQNAQSVISGVPHSEELLPVHPWAESSGNRWHAPNASLQAVICENHIASFCL